MVYVLCFCGLVVPSVLELCPEGVVNGILTFVGLQGILPGTGNQMIDRCVLLLTAPSEFHLLPSTAPYMKLRWYRIHLFTAIQVRTSKIQIGSQKSFLWDVLVAFQHLTLLVFPQSWFCRFYGYQLTCLAACWGMRFTGPFSLTFPLVVVGFVPFRLYVLPKVFSEDELSALDAEGDLNPDKKEGIVLEDNYAAFESIEGTEKKSTTGENKVGVLV